jgi:hypothetical protein
MPLIANLLHNAKIPWAIPVILMLGISQPCAEKVSDPSHLPGIDTNLIRKLYMDGDFDPASEILEKELKSDFTLNHTDSVFIYKHLGVMYAARYETRERGKMYMHQLLMTEPTAKIMDMYASDMIYMIFKNIQDEFETNRARLVRAQSLVNQNPPPDSTGSPKPNPGSGKTLAIWIGAAAIGLGVGAYFLITGLSSGGSSTHSF